LFFSYQVPQSAADAQAVNAMIRRSSTPHELRSPRGPYTAAPLAVAVVAVMLTLQGCNLQVPNPFDKGNKRSMAMVPQEETSSSPGPISSPSSSGAYTVMPTGGGASLTSSCDPLVDSKSEAFQNEIQRDAGAYYNGVVSAFSADFVKYPFCLENDEFVVNSLDRRMRGSSDFKDLSLRDFDDKLNKTIKDQFHDHENTWMNMCRDWADQNKEHQIHNIDMVRNVLNLDGVTVSDNDLKNQITAFYNWQPWWDFFSEVTKSGCVRQYTQRCVNAVKASRRHAKELVVQTTGRQDMNWHAFADPGETDHGGGWTNASDHTAMSLTEEKQRSTLRRPHLVPVELKAGGQQLRTVSRHSQPAE